MKEETLLEELDSMIEYYKQRDGHLPNRIRIGYRAYTKLMQSKSFCDELLNSAIDPNKRKYKKIKIKVTKDDYQLQLE
jgi:hypothetical protein